MTDLTEQHVFAVGGSSGIGLAVVRAALPVRSDRGSVVLTRPSYHQTRSKTTMHAIWIEIPVADVRRARDFYANVFGVDAPETVEQTVRRIVVIDGQPTVSLNETPGFVPSTDGSLPYFEVANLDAALTAVIASGGAIAEPAAERPGLGRFALVHDSEGNALYLHGAA